ncbi:MAG: hypothetical protein HW388_552 [Dehalococcoidia bacterium]|nr:hypothetical protein [Dehalococcoidia bacterium]
MFHLRRQSRWASALSLLLLLTVEPSYAQASPSAPELVSAFCRVAQWKSGRILSTYDVVDDAYNTALTAAESVSLPGLQAPDIGGWRARVRTLTDKVCSAPDAGAARGAMEELATAQNDNMKAIQMALEALKQVMDTAKLNMDQRVREQMKPFEEEIRKGKEQAINAERDRLLKEGEPPNTLTAEEQQQLQSFTEQKRMETETWLKAKGQEIGGAGMERLKAVGAPFSAMKNKLDAHKSATEAEWPTIRTQFVQQQKEIILRDIDDKIANARTQIEEQARGLSQEERGKRGVDALLSAITTARGSLEQPLGAALEARDKEGVRRAVDTFWGSWAGALCASTVGQLQTARGQAEKALQQLQGVTGETAKVQEAVTALSGFVQRIDQSLQACQAVGMTSGPAAVKELGGALKTVQQAAVEVQKVLESPKAP